MKKLIFVNPLDAAWTRNRYILWFGACGSVKLLAHANGLDEAFDVCVDYIAENMPGLLCDEMVAKAYKEAIDRGLTEEEAYEEALTDVTTGGNCGNHILSYEWGLVCENPSRLAILTAAGV